MTRTLLIIVLLLTAGAAGLRAAAGDDGAPRIDRVDVALASRLFVTEEGSEQRLDRRVTIDGAGFYGTAFGPWVRFRLPDGELREAVMVIIESEARLLAWPPAGTVGSLVLEVENPDHQVASRQIVL
jgi:hypothetical protein